MSDSTFTLVIGNYNTSSWSLRAWLVLRLAGLDFEVEKIDLRAPDAPERLADLSPSGRVPVLWAEGVPIWDSLAIAEFAAELRPEIWPTDTVRRAQARSIAAEIHAGFADLRAFMPMDATSRYGPPGRLLKGVSRDVERIKAICHACRDRHGAEGPFLMGDFSVADAMMAPLASRFVTYGLDLEPALEDYVDSLMSWPAMVAWLERAAAETEATPRHRPAAAAPPTRPAAAPAEARPAATGAGSPPSSAAGREEERQRIAAEASATMRRHAAPPPVEAPSAETTAEETPPEEASPAKARPERAPDAEARPVRAPDAEARPVRAPEAEARPLRPPQAERPPEPPPHPPEPAIGDSAKPRAEPPAEEGAPSPPRRRPFFLRPKQRQQAASAEPEPAPSEPAPPEDTRPKAAERRPGSVWVKPIGDGTRRRR